MSAEPEMLKLPEAGAELGISRWLAYELYNRGEFPVPVLKLGRCLRVSRAVLRRYIETGEPIKSGAS